MSHQPNTVNPTNDQPLSPPRVNTEEELLVLKRLLQGASASLKIQIATLTMFDEYIVNNVDRSVANEIRRNLEGACALLGGVAFN